MSKFFISLETTATKPRLCFRVGGVTLFAPLKDYDTGYYYIKPGVIIDGATLYDMLLTMLPASGSRTALSHSCVVRYGNGVIVQTRSDVTQYKYLPTSDSTGDFMYQHGIGCDGTKTGGASGMTGGIDSGLSGVMRNADYFFQFPNGLVWA